MAFEIGKFLSMGLQTVGVPKSFSDTLVGSWTVGKDKQGNVLNTVLTSPPLVINPAYTAWAAKYGEAYQDARFGIGSVPEKPPYYINDPNYKPNTSYYNVTGNSTSGSNIKNSYSGITDAATSVKTGYKNLTAKYPVLAYAAPAATFLSIGWGVYEFVNRK